MDNESRYSPRLMLRVYRLPEDGSAEQPRIERAEEDLLSALSLYRRGACGYLPLVTVCFLLHQALEKWLKAFIAVQGIQVSAKRLHDLHSRFMAVETKYPEFGEVRREIEQVAPEILDHKFPGDLRYNETPADIEICAKALMKAAFAVRRLGKRHFKKLEEGDHELS